MGRSCCSCTSMSRVACAVVLSVGGGADVGSPKQMRAARVNDGATIGGVTISNANKVWWPDEGITKGDVARFYHAISPLLLPWMRDRPLTAERCPERSQDTSSGSETGPAGGAAQHGQRTRRFDH